MSDLPLWALIGGGSTVWLLLAAIPGGYLARWICEIAPGCRDRMNRQETIGQCRRAHGSDCWGIHDRVQPWMAAVGLVLGILWPLVLPGYICLTVANRKVPYASLQEQIERMERENGMNPPSLKSVK